MASCLHLPLFPSGSPMCVRPPWHDRRNRRRIRTTRHRKITTSIRAASSANLNTRNVRMNPGNRPVQLLPSTPHTNPAHQHQQACCVERRSEVVSPSQHSREEIKHLAHDFRPRLGAHFPNTGVSLQQFLLCHLLNG